MGKKNISRGLHIAAVTTKNNTSKIVLWFVSRFVLPEEYSIVSTVQNERGLF